MSGTPYHDTTAGLRLRLPPGWDADASDPEDDDPQWLTTALFPPSSRAGRDAQDTEDAQESQDSQDDDWGPTWGEVLDAAARGDGAQFPVAAAPPDSWSGGPARDDPEDWLDLDDLYNYLGCYVGRWRGLPQDPPDPDELLDGADWLATWFIEPWEWFVPDVIHGFDRTVRKAVFAGRPAAVARYHYLATETGDTAAYLRLVLVQLPDGTVSFVVGAAQSDADRALIDACLDSVEPLPAR